METIQEEEEKVHDWNVPSLEVLCSFQSSSVYMTLQLPAGLSFTPVVCRPICICPFAGLEQV